MRAPFAVTARRLLAVAFAALGLAACGQQSHPTSGDSEGAYVDAGPITYQVQLSRELNPYAVEDKEYLSGQSATPPKPDEEWFGVFLWAKNQSHAAAPTADTFDIIDTQGNRYFPIPINAQVNPFAWTQQTLAHGGIEPGPDTAASFSPTQGGELLFKLNSSVYGNRPLTLEIYPPGQSRPSSISLDL